MPVAEVLAPGKPKYTSAAANLQLWSLPVCPKSCTQNLYRWFVQILLVDLEIPVCSAGLILFPRPNQSKQLVDSHNMRRRSLEGCPYKQPPQPRSAMNYCEGGNQPCSDWEPLYLQLPLL